MSDFSELENDLKALRPARPSPVLFQRIEEAMGENYRAGASRAEQPARSPYNWLSLGFGLAAAAVLLLFAVLRMEQRPGNDSEIAQVAPASETRSMIPAPSGRSRVDGSMVSNKFVPAGATQVVYNTRNEGLQFADGSRQPLRRLRYQTQQTWQWRNPSTGASLRVSYPSEEVVLIPVSGQ
ncbi:MAG: hypothetical protein DME65_05425 [Verrucomicrobia bacterium]|nr:MAG: hypothetical protein DME65_05425 [Verrucomicrobiota bacterium]